MRDLLAVIGGTALLIALARGLHLLDQADAPSAVFFFIGAVSGVVGSIAYLHYILRPTFKP